MLCATFAFLLVLRRERECVSDVPLAAAPPVRPLAVAPRLGGARVAAMAAREPVERSGAPAPVEPTDVDAEGLESWRREQLLALGLDADSAEGAAREGVDASSVRSLVERGCPPELALRILR